jgi:MYXO-CTERM domain-containing protein
VDEAGAVGEIRWYYDGDSDGYGDPTTAVDACSAPARHVANGADCDDARASSNPIATEYCNGYDDDCDGVVDEGSAADASTWYLDADGDGYGIPGSTTRACSLPAGYSAVATDCDDGRAADHPGATETCDGRDNDCDGLVDEGCEDLDTGGAGGGKPVGCGCASRGASTPASGALAGLLGILLLRRRAAAGRS